MIVMDAETGDALWAYPSDEGDPLLGPAMPVKGGVIVATEKGKVMLIWE